MMMRAKRYTVQVTMRAPKLDRITFSIDPVAPFRLDLTAWALRRRSQNTVDRWDGATYRRVFPFDDIPIEVAVRQAWPPNTLRLQVTLTGPGLRPEFKHKAKTLVGKMFGLHVDLASFYQMASHNAKLQILVENFRGVKPPCFPTIFETLCNAFACQQLSLSVGLELLSRLVCACGLTLEQNGEIQHAFPRPEDLLKLTPNTIQKLGFSGNKVSAFLELAESIFNGRISFDSLEKMDNKAVIGWLLKLRGVGRWTAEYVLLRGLKRLDVFPGDDVGARNRLAKWQHRKEPLDYAAVARLTHRWQSYAGMVYFHMLLEGLSEAGKLK